MSRLGSGGTCSVEGCDGRHYARGWCRVHWERWRRTGSTDLLYPPGLACSIEGCEKPAMSRGWCLTHYERWRRQGDPTIVRPNLGLPPLLVCRKGHDRTDSAKLYRFKRANGTIGTKCRRCHDEAVLARRRRRRAAARAARLASYRESGTT